MNYQLTIDIDYDSEDYKGLRDTLRDPRVLQAAYDLADAIVRAKPDRSICRVRVNDLDRNQYLADTLKR